MSARGPASVEEERWRLFIAFTLDAVWISEIVRWQRDTLAGNDRLRLIRGDDLHVTLAFLGNVPRKRTLDVEAVMGEVVATAVPPTLAPTGITATRSVLMILLEDAGEHATALQRSLADRLEQEALLQRDRRPWKPHVTVARSRASKRIRVDAAPPALMAWSPSELALYHSPLHVRRAPYDIVHTLPIGGFRG